MGLLDSIKGRKGARSQFGYGITTADSYLKHIQACAGEGVCRSSNPWSAVADAPDWSSVVKEAGNKLVYSNDDTRVKSDTVTTNSSDFRKTLNDEDTIVPPRTIMVFQNIVTTPKQDRDGDVLKTEGAEIDAAMPLLWQHMHVAPIGRMIEVVEHSKDRLLVTSAVIDSALGNDTANLIEFGALRISHGFIPKEYQELDTKEGDMPGFEITKFEIMEESVVSVPSNTDAIIEAVSRGKLADPLVKEWAKHYYENRPIVASGIDMEKFILDPVAKSAEPDDDETETETEADDSPVEIIDEDVSGEDGHDDDEKESCCDEIGECGCDSAAEEKAGKPYPNEHACRLESPDKYNDFRRDEREADNGKVYTVIYGHDSSDDAWHEQAFRYLKEDWDEAEARQHCDGHNGQTFEPATATEDSIDLTTKGGRVLSARNAKAIESAVELIEDISKADSSDVSARYRALANEALRGLQSILKDAGDEDETSRDTETDSEGKSVSLEDAAKQLLVMAGDADPTLLKRVALVLNETADATERQRDEDEFKAVLKSLV